MEQDVPLCTRCLRPVRKSDHYCECGEAVGQFTTYLPFVDIPFQADFLGGIWRWTWRPGRNWIARALSIVSLGLIAAPLIVFGLPYLLWVKLRGPRRSSRDPVRYPPS
ncbi:MAG: hypothetical protein ACYTGN_09225 [Planctomycetota bacterium]|jgi:hypothetical protein